MFMSDQTYLKTIAFIFGLLIVVLSPVYIEAKSYKNKLGTFPPIHGFPPVIVERFSNQGNTISCGILLGFSDFDKEFMTLVFSNPVSFKTRMYAFNPYVAWYSGNARDWIRPGIKIVMSFIVLDPGQDLKDVFVFPAYELHLFADMKKDQFYATPSFGFKHFLTKQTISFNDETTIFPEIKLFPKSLPQTWVPAVEFPFGLLY